MKIKFEVCPYEEKYEADTLFHANTFRWTLQAVDNRIREVLKYGNVSQETAKELEDLRTLLYESLDGVDLH